MPIKFDICFCPSFQFYILNINLYFKDSYLHFNQLFKNEKQYNLEKLIKFKLHFLKSINSKLTKFIFNT